MLFSKLIHTPMWLSLIRNAHGYHVSKCKLVRPLTPGMEEIVGDAINNLRAALDHAAYGIAVASGRVKPRHTYFPFAGTAAKFDVSARGLCKDVPDEIFTLFRALKPYKGGDDILWALNQIAIGDKHKLLTAMGSAVFRNRLKINGRGGLLRIPTVPVWNPTTE
ncbi:MAG: hypothetical protein M3O35_21605 [Acidobacteriota bacterium]|nr:hypothetical protein [Acidobacteriota bacterium]